MKKIVLMFLLSFTSLVFSQLSRYEKNALDFEFEKVKLGTSLANFKAKYLSATEVDSPNKEYGEVYYSVADLKSATTGLYAFYEDKLSAFVVIYNKELINRMGGAITLAEKLVSKFGRPKVHADDSSISEKSAVWNFGAIKRYCSITETDEGGVALVFKNTEVAEKINKMKASNADVGF